jgi:hypothetical protein
MSAPRNLLLTYNILSYIYCIIYKMMEKTNFYTYSILLQLVLFYWLITYINTPSLIKNIYNFATKMVKISQ